MSEPDHGADAPAAAADEGWAEVARCASAKEGFERGLVVLAMGLPYVLREGAGAEGEGGFRLLVQAEGSEAVRGQLDLYERESADWPPKRTVRGDGARGGWALSLFVALLWAWALLGCFALQSGRPETTELFAMDARAVFERGEWWRPATALFLHADTGHLLSNLAGGVFLVALVLSGWGRARGAALLGAASVAANVAVGAAYYPNEYRSLGASTAVFAALGLLTGRALRRAVAGPGGGTAGRGREAGSGRAGWRGALTPLAAGATMLMLYGAGAGEGGVSVDVPAHAAGFCAGVVAGFAAGNTRREAA